MTKKSKKTAKRDSMLQEVKAAESLRIIQELKEDTYLFKTVHGRLEETSKKVPHKSAWV